jgi:flagellar M-ring protein FliF
MNARLQAMWRQLAGFFLGLPPARRMLLVGVGGASMAVVLGLAWWAQRPLYRPLFTNLSTTDAAAIVEALKAEKVAYRFDDDGRAVLVPAERLYELRLALAARGLPEGGGVGFEIFDKQSLGVTDFLQRLNYQRALQGELGRTIGQLGGVEAARVHLALPERSLFVAEDRRPSASVVVKLVPGRTLGRSQIDGIVHLVAASVEGLDADAVTVVDESGRMLTADRHGDPSGGSSTALELQGSVERQIAERVESMLGAVVGRDKAIARVAAALDFARVERTEETYDPDRAVVKSQRTTREQTTGPRSAAGGPPGVQANLTNDAAATTTAESEGPRSERRDESQSYEVSKVVSRTIGPVGALKQLSVAVLIDGTYTEDKGKRTFVTRPQAELDRLKELVKGAVGFSETRGDKIEVACVPFQAEPAPAAEGILGVVGRWAPVVLVRLLAVAFAAGMLLYVVRPVVLALAARPTGSAGPVPSLAGLEIAAAQLTHENLTLAQQNPERAAQLVREWLQEGHPALGPGD